MIYFDNAATTQMDPEVTETVSESMRRDFANSGTVYPIGLDAKNRIERASEEIAESLCLPPSYRLVFTSGGSESNNLFIKGLCFPNRKVACLGLEHTSIMAMLDYFCEFSNPPLKLLEYQTEGRLDPEAIPVLNENDIRLLCLSHVNNELGSVNKPRDLVWALSESSSRTRLFLDGVQAIGKIPINADFWEGIAGYSASGHKINGPKGIGLLIYDSKLNLTPQIHGGQQQYGIRSGTLPVPLILGMAHAVRLAVERQAEATAHITNLNRHLVGGLKDLSEKIPEFNLRFNSAIENDMESQSPAIVNFSFPPVEGEVILHHLEEKAIYVGLGSACSSHSKEPSKILKGIGLTDEEARCSLRISFSRTNSIAEVDSFLNEFASAYSSLYPTFLKKLA